MKQTTKTILRMNDKRGLLNGRTVAGNVARQQVIKAGSDQLLDAQRTFGTWQVIVETATALPPVRGLEAMAGQRGLYYWQSTNRYTQGVAQSLAGALLTRDDIISTYTQETDQ